MGTYLGGFNFVVPQCERLITKRRAKCAHDISDKLTTASKLMLKTAAIPFNDFNLKISQILLKEGFLRSIANGDLEGINYEPFSLKDSSKRRYWLTLNYYQNQPVLTSLKPVSLPSRKIFADHKELGLILGGRQIGLLKPLIPGEVIILNTDKGIMEAHKALELKLGGMVLCRAI